MQKSQGILLVSRIGTQLIWELKEKQRKMQRDDDNGDVEESE